MIHNEADGLGSAQYRSEIPGEPLPVGVLRPINCECDNTHEQNNTCCMPCWNAGFRVVPTQAEIEAHQIAYDFDLGRP